MWVKSFRFGAAVVSVAALFHGCSEGWPPEIIEMGSISTMAQRPEVERLRYFSEINTFDALSVQKLTGKGVQIAIMGEMVDATHPELIKNVLKQYNAFSKKGTLLQGPGNLVLGAGNLGPNDGHGTHIAGTIAAACDGVGIQGLACDAKLEVYNLGAYDNSDKWPFEGWGKVHEISRFLSAFTASLKHLAKFGKSKITTGSFNLEAPAIRLHEDEKIYRGSIDDLFSRVKNYDGTIDALIKARILKLSDTADANYLRRVIAANYNDKMIVLGSLISQTREWDRLIDAIAAYQAKDAVYLITESNYRFEDRSSVLNAMPSLSSKVDPDLWLSVVMVTPEGIEKAIEEKKSREEFLTWLQSATYTSTLNSCRTMAANYCIVTPSWSVFSTMTKRVAFQNAGPLFQLDGRIFQTLGGHSMGAPMMAATLALMEENNIRNNYGYTMRDLVRLLKDNANRSFSGYDPKKHGRGMLDVSAAVNAMKKN